MGLPQSCTYVFLFHPLFWLITNINFIHGWSLTALHFRRVYAAFALDQKNFFGSSDVQFLRIGTVIKGGILLPPTVDTPENNYNLFSISITPEMGQEFFEAFGSLFSPEDYAISRGECGLIFEIKLRAPQYWQVKIRILLNAACRTKLEELILKRHLVANKRSCVEIISQPDKNDNSWKRILHIYCATLSHFEHFCIYISICIHFHPMFTPFGAAGTAYG